MCPLGHPCQEEGATGQKDTKQEQTMSDFPPVPTEKLHQNEWFLDEGQGSSVQQCKSRLRSRHCYTAEI